MVSKAKRRARAEAAAAAEAAVDGGGPSSAEESSDSEGEAVAVRPAKRIKGAAGAAAPAPGAGQPEGGWRNKEKPLVLCSRGIPGRCVAPGGCCFPAARAGPQLRVRAPARVHARGEPAPPLSAAIRRCHAAWRLLRLTAPLMRLHFFIHACQMSGACPALITQIFSLRQRSAALGARARAAALRPRRLR